MWPLVPDQAPQNVLAFNTSSTSINVTWQPVAVGHVRGILLGYRLVYQHLNEEVNVTVSHQSTRQQIVGLKKFTVYSFSIAAFTSKGTGPFSNSIDCSTDEDSECSIFFRSHFPCTNSDPFFNHLLIFYFNIYKFSKFI